MNLKTPAERICTCGHSLAAHLHKNGKCLRSGCACEKFTETKDVLEPAEVR